MKKIYLLLLAIGTSVSLMGQKGFISGHDSITTKDLNEVVVSVTRSKIPLKEIPASISVVNQNQLGSMSKTIAADEALRLVPGVRVDNGTSGSRVHLYIRGQGVLTESGFRGIGVLIDGIPVSDPAGFTPDLYDVDWATVSNVEIVKGLAASLYGTGATGGLVNINTMDGGKKPAGGMFHATAGSNGFFKILEQVDGTQGNMNYRVSYSHTQGNGYRIHQAFRGDNFSEKVNWTPSSKLKISQFINYTEYFNQNSEGISMARYEKEGPTAANTDAIPFNEFHKTQRLTAAFSGKYDFLNNQDIQVKAYGRMNKYRETSNNGDDHKPFVNNGVSVQYDLHLGSNNFRNLLSLGGDYATKTITEIEFGVNKDTTRTDSHFSESVLDRTDILINQIIRQRSTGIFLIDKFDIARKFHVMLNLRYDYIYNQLINNINLPDTIAQASELQTSGNRTFDSPSFRIGAGYDFAKFFNVYANYGTGFLIPSEDELYNNPDHWGGFNTRINPSKLMGGELGIRGDFTGKLYYDITGFLTTSKDEFYRYSIEGRGNNTAFFGNIGSSRRYGVETFISYSPLNYLRLDAAYTYANCRYTKPDSISNQFIPQCPEHVLAAEASFKFLGHLTLIVGTEYQSKWYIQTKPAIYNQYLEISEGLTTLRNSWVKGFNTYSAELKYNFSIMSVNGEISLFGKNLLDEHYFGFTEPNDPDEYNSYQPAPGRELFVSLKLRF